MAYALFILYFLFSKGNYLPISTNYSMIVTLVFKSKIKIEVILYFKGIIRGVKEYYLNWEERGIVESKTLEKKKEIWLSPMTKSLIPTEKSKINGQLKTPPKTSITQRLRTVSWSYNCHSTGVVKRANGHRNIENSKYAVCSVCAKLTKIYRSYMKISQND